MPEGSPATVHCSSPSDPEPVLSWGYGTPDGPLPDDAQVSPDSKTLTIPKCSQGHTGQWFCTAENPNGKTSKPATVNVVPGRLF